MVWKKILVEVLKIAAMVAQHNDFASSESTMPSLMPYKLSHCALQICRWFLEFWSVQNSYLTTLSLCTDRSKAVLLLWIFYVFVLSCVCYVLCASVYMCFVVTCWERADLLALVCGVFCEFVTFPLVSWVRCGTWLYRFLIFAPLLTFVTYTWPKPFYTHWYYTTRQHTKTLFCGEIIFQYL